jgi:hypothetical protein
MSFTYDWDDWDGWTSNENGADGADIEAAQWNNANWWKDTAKFPGDAWEFRNGLPILKGMPGGTQNPEVTP